MVKEEETPKSPTMEEIENDPIELESKTLEQKCEKKLSKEDFKALKKIAYFLSKVGMTLEEACFLVDIEIEKMEKLMEKYPFIQKIVHIKELQYKKGLLKTISLKAFNGNDKLAQWLLEKRHPAEFGAKKSGPTSNDEDMLGEAIDYIQKTGSNTPLIDKKKSSKPVNEDGKKSNSLIKKIEDILT